MKKEGAFGWAARELLQTITERDTAFDAKKGRDMRRLALIPRAEFHGLFTNAGVYIEVVPDIKTLVTRMVEILFDETKDISTGLKEKSETTAAPKASKSNGGKPTSILV